MITKYIYFFFQWEINVSSGKENKKTEDRLYTEHTFIQERSPEKEKKIVKGVKDPSVQKRSCYASKMEVGKRGWMSWSKSLRERYLEYFTYPPNEYSRGRSQRKAISFSSCPYPYACHLHNDWESMRR